MFDEHIDAAFCNSMPDPLYVVPDGELASRALDSGDTLNLERLVQQIHAGNPLAVEELYEIINSGVRFKLLSEVAFHEVNDRTHNILLIVLQAIQTNRIRNSGALLSYIQTVTNRQISSHIREMVEARKRLSPLECSALSNYHDGDSATVAISHHQREEILLAAFKTLRETDQEILRRFYIDEQPMKFICEDMGLTETQFRLNKSRAKAKLVAAGQKMLKLQRIPPRSLFALARATGTS